MMPIAANAAKGVATRYLLGGGKTRQDMTTLLSRQGEASRASIMTPVCIRAPSLRHAMGPCPQIVELDSEPGYQKLHPSWTNSSPRRACVGPLIGHGP